MSRDRRFMLAAVACASAAALVTFFYTGRVAEGERASTPVLTSLAPIGEGDVLGERGAAPLAVRRVPGGSAPPDVLSDAVDAAGLRARVDLPAGSFLTRSVLSGAEDAADFSLRRGERAVTLEATRSPGERELASGSRVDLFVSGLGAGQRTRALITGAEVLAVDESASRAKPRLTLRLRFGQVAAAVRADVFAREVRAVNVPEGSP